MLAEEDLIMRGPGDLFGERQTGNIPFKMADLVLDRELLLEADAEAEALINRRETLYGRIRETLRNRAQKLS